MVLLHVGLRTLVYKDSKLEVNSLRSLEPVQMTEERSGVVVHRRRKHQSGSRPYGLITLNMAEPAIR